MMCSMLRTDEIDFLVLTLYYSLAISILETALTHLILSITDVRLRSCLFCEGRISVLKR